MADKITPDQLMRATWSKAPTTVAISGTTARSAQLTAGAVYEVTSDVDCYILQGDVTVDATTSSVPLWSKTTKLVHVPDATSHGYIAVIQLDTAGTLYISEPRGDD